MSKSFHSRSLELDMSEVETINMKTMALLTTTLKELKASGIRIKVMGLNGANLILAKKLGMHYILRSTKMEK
jgi:ABC-type transporter Mla MlaB component